MKKIHVNTHDPYDVIFYKGGLSEVAGTIAQARGVSRVMIVTDSNVGRLYLDPLVKRFAECGFDVRRFVFEAGEKSKTTETYLGIVNALALNEFNRNDLVVALGGGVVGDLAGFAAATYMRGIDVIQIPTTLLAAIDSSIGGKTGVDLSAGKNLLGAFHQPKLVFADADTFKTLKENDIKNGLGEGIKYALIAGGETLEILRDGLNEDNTEEFCAECARIKIKIVEEDEREGGLRKLLNLGHTIGHAIEKLSGYEAPHGIAVAKGIALMASAAVKSGEAGKELIKTIRVLTEKYGLDVSVPFSASQISECLSLDKKAESISEISVIKIFGIGDCRICRTRISEFEKYISMGLGEAR